jgi:succinyl-CoA:acetate CoA-transferase
MVYITERGIADLRGLAPHQRARLIIKNCAHPDYQPLLSEYLDWAEKSCEGHIPHDLSQALAFHCRFTASGSMKE